MAAMRARNGDSRSRRARNDQEKDLPSRSPNRRRSGLLEAAERLRAKDPELIDRLVAIGGPPPLRRRDAGFAGMAAIIVAQQVSTASATAIFGRLQARIVPLEAAEIAKATEEELRACGLSNAKIRALRALAQAIVDGGLDLEGLGSLDAEDAHKRWLRSKGSVPGRQMFSSCSASAIPTPFPPAILRCRKPPSSP